MADAHQFVAGKLWLLVAIVTLPLASLAAIAGLGPLAGAITVVGWFLLTPILLFFGHEIADLVVGGADAEEASGESAAAAGAGADADATAADDPVETLKERYASGEIDEVEFERTLERLVALDGVEVDDAARDVLVGAGAERPDGEHDATDRDPGDGEERAPTDESARDVEPERE